MASNWCRWETNRRIEIVYTDSSRSDSFWLLRPGRATLCLTVTLRGKERWMSGVFYTTKKALSSGILHGTFNNK